MTEWSEILERRDRLAALLRPHLGKAPAQDRANNIMQALLCAEERADEVALRILVRDLEPRAAEVVAFQLGRAWEAPSPLPLPRVSVTVALDKAAGSQSSERNLMPLARAATGARFKRPRRETVMVAPNPRRQMDLHWPWK